MGSKTRGPKESDYAPTQTEQTAAAIAKADADYFERTYDPLLVEMRDKAATEDVASTIRGRAGADTMQALTSNLDLGVAQNMGAAFGRLITETMVPIIRRTLFIMDEKGLIQLPLKIDGLEVKVVPISPLAKAQNLEEVNEVMQFFQIANSLGPGGVAEIKPDAIAAFVGDKLGIPASLRNSEEEKQQIQQQAMAMQQQMMMQQQPPGNEQPQDQAPPQEEPAMALEAEARS